MVFKLKGIRIKEPLLAEEKTKKQKKKKFGKSGFAVDEPFLKKKGGMF